MILLENQNFTLNLKYESELFPFELFGTVFVDFDQINAKLNKLWTIQIIICLFYCIKQKKYVPSLNFKHSIFIKQIYVYFLTTSFVYLIEILFSNVLIAMFERFMHHMFAIMILCSVMLEPQILSVVFIFPFLIHSIYWLKTNGEYSEAVLIIYNLDILINVAIMIYMTYNRKLKCYSYRVPLFATLLYNINMFGHLYGYGVNLMNLNIHKCLISFLISCCVSFPFYFYLLYVNLSNVSSSDLKMKSLFYEI